jgi:hypothetical protein
MHSELMNGYVGAWEYHVPGLKLNLPKAKITEHKIFNFFSE